MFETSKTDWTYNNVPTKDDFDRIEKNIKYLQELLG
jgi:hypothetical protein